LHGGVSGVLATLGSSVFWTSWRCSVTYQLCLHVLFPLSAAPFVFFQMPALDKLLSRTSPTGYDPYGRPRPLDVRGLSAYVTWLETFTRSSGARRHLTTAEMALLTKAAKQARAHLETRPHEAREYSKRRRAEIDALLTTMVAPSHPLYSAVFPDRLICAQFERQLLLTQQLPAKLAKQQELRAEMERKFGVDWQADRSAVACTICKLKWAPRPRPRP